MEQKIDRDVSEYLSRIGRRGAYATISKFRKEGSLKKHMRRMAALSVASRQKKKQKKEKDAQQSDKEQAVDSLI